MLAPFSIMISLAQFHDLPEKVKIATNYVNHQQGKRAREHFEKSSC